MDFVIVIFTAIGLAMDCFSVAIANGVKQRTISFSQAITIGIYFGLFQGMMPLGGWYLGLLLKNFVAFYGHFIAFLLLAFIGTKMILEALKKDSKEVSLIDNTKTLLLLSFATSIDAFIAGITLGLMKIPLVFSIIVISLITFLLAFSGSLIGKKLGEFFGEKMEIIGGVILLGLAFKALLGA